MSLEVGNFYVKDIVFGDVTEYKDGILTVNKEEAVKALNPEGNLKNIDLHVARPGESVRILPIKAAVAPRARKDGRAAFPGYTGNMAPCGEGKLYALENMSVMAVGKYGGWMEGIIDMSGPAQELSPYGTIINLCFTAENSDPDIDQGQHANLHYRMGAHLLAEYIGKAVLDGEPEEWITYDLKDVSGQGFPKVVMVQLLSTFYDTYGFDDVFYGVDCVQLVPTLVHPAELIDGALCSSSLIPAGQHNSTYDYQNHPMLKKLFAEHGKTIDFAGVIITSIGPTIERKDRAAIRVAEIASMLHCDGAVYVQASDGNPDIDFFKCIVALEEKGIKTVGMCSESTGRDGTTQPTKVMLDARADAIVCTGNAAEVLDLPAMDRVIGDLESVVRDPYPGSWADSAEFGPSLRPDGSIIIDAHSYLNNDGMSGWSHKTCKNF